MFPLYLTTLAIIFLAVALTGAAWALLGGWSAARDTADAPLPLSPEELDHTWFSIAGGWHFPADVAAEPPKDSKPFLSVVIYAINHGDELVEAVNRMAEQRCEFEYEIIVVCNASAAETASLGDSLSHLHGVHLTFVPPESHNLSRRKLAFTMGIKASRGEAVLLTASNAEPPSAGWFQLMGSPFLHTPATTVAMGLTRLDFDHIHGASRWYQQFLWVMARCRCVAEALADRPFRGDWMNLAVRRSAFFNHKGYASTINIETGDDDIFLTEVATAGGTSVVLSPMAMPVAKWEEVASRVWKDQREAYVFTSRWLPRAPFLKEGALSCCQWIVLTACIAAGLAPLCSGLPYSWLSAIVAFLLWVGFELLQIRIYRKAAMRLMAVRLWWAVPVFMLWRPIGNLLFRLNHLSSARKNYTWQR